MTPRRLRRGSFTLLAVRLPGCPGPDNDDPSPIDTAPIDTAPIDTAPIDTAPIDTARSRWGARGVRWGIL